MIRIERCEQDFRAQTGLNCALQYEPDPKTYFLLVDDDVVYHPSLLETLLAESSRNPGAMIGAQAYRAPGVYCRGRDAAGVCTLPNLVHTTFGKLLQRRFFDGGIFNFAAPAHAYARLQLGAPASADYIVTSCMVGNDLWTEAHLAKKAIPRVFMRGSRWGRLITQLAFQYGALNSNYQGTYHHHSQDPHTIDEGEQTCMQALSALWGPTLWGAHPRQMAAAFRAAQDDAGAAIVAQTLAGLAWWQYDALVVFVCKRRSLSTWRQQLSTHGGLDSRILYLHEYVGLDSTGQPRFHSELYDPSAFVPEKLAMKADHVALRWSFFPSSFIPGHENAGVLRPLVDVVELCPALTGESERAVEQAAGDALGKCPDAFVLENTCQENARVSTLSGSGYAGVKCCDGPICNHIGPSRNWSVHADMGFGLCFPYSSTYADAVRVCHAVGATLCDADTVRGCCGLGCLGYFTSTWLRTRELEQLEACMSPPRAKPSLQPRPRVGADVSGVVDGASLAARAQQYFHVFQEAHSTTITWI